MYILECADGSYYTGSTWNLERRLWEHQNGLGANHTARNLPVKLVYCEETDRIDDAFYREKQVQGWSRKKKEALIKGKMNQLHQLAECQNESHCANIAAGFDSAQPAGEMSKSSESNHKRSPVAERSRSEKVKNQEGMLE
jgi:putative endonuclease